MKSFNVIRGNFNTGKFETYDVIPYLIHEYQKVKKSRSKFKPTPKTFEEFKEFVKKEAMYRWWAKCEYEIILFPWPYKANKEGHIDDFSQAYKLDVYEQVMMNIDVITELLMESVKTRKKRIREE